MNAHEGLSTVPGIQQALKILAIIMMIIREMAQNSLSHRPEENTGIHLDTPFQCISICDVHMFF